MRQFFKPLAVLLCAVMLLMAACHPKTGVGSSSGLTSQTDPSSGAEGEPTGDESSGEGDPSAESTADASSSASGPKGSGSKTTKTNQNNTASKPTTNQTGGTSPMEIDFHASYMGNVKNCGAAGDGKTDDTQAIQRLLDNWPEKCTLYFPAGTYLISAPLKVRAGTNLVGEPAKNGVGGAVIKAAKSMDYLIGAAGAKLCDAVYMNLTLDGGRTNGCKLGSLLDMPGFCSMKLANIKLTNCSGHGVHTYQGTKDDPTWISIVENIEVQNVAGYGLEMINSDTAFNHIYVNGGKGLMDFNYGGNVYNDILVENSTGSGLTIGRENRNENGHCCILNSTFRNNKGHGLQLSTQKGEEKYVQVEGCDFSGNGGGDVGISNVDGCTFYNNNFRSARAFAGARTSSGVTLTGNRFAQAAFSQSGYMIDSSNVFGATSFTDKGTALDKDRYDYAKVYKAAALQSSSGRAVDLQQFNPVPSSFEDNSGALQKAIDALGSQGGIVYISSGTYGIGKKVTIPSNVILVGEGINSTVAFSPSQPIDTLFEIKKGATGAGFLNCNVVNPGQYELKYFIKGDSLKNCFFDSVQGDGNVVNSVANVIYLSNSQDCVVNAMICGVNDGGNMTYLKDCRNCVIQTSYISRGTNGTVVDGGSGHVMFNNHYDWFYGSAARFQNNASDCLFYNNYCDINQRVVTVDGAQKIAISSCVSRESGIPARNALLQGGAARRELPEFFLKNAKNVQIIGFSSDIWGRDSAINRNMLELQGSNDYITLKGCICGSVFNSSQASRFGAHSVETNNFLY